MINGGGINFSEINGAGALAFLTLPSVVATLGYDVLPLSDRGQLVGTECAPPNRNIAKPGEARRTATIGGRPRC